MVDRFRGNGWEIVADDDGLKMIGKATPRLEKQFGLAFRDISQDIPVKIVRRMTDYSGGKRPKESPLQVRTGRLARTVRGVKKGSSLRDLRAVILAGGGDVKYAAIQEYGRTIKPVRAKALRVPLPEILTPAGNVKGDYEIVERAGRYMTAGGLETYISGRAIMVDKGGKPTPIWALVKSVKIPPRLGMGDTIKGSSSEIRARFIEAIRRSLES